MKDYKNAILVAALLLGAGAVQASIITTGQSTNALNAGNSTDTEFKDVAGYFASNIVADDLINTGVNGSLASSVVPPATFGANALNTGLGDGFSTSQNTFYNLAQLGQSAYFYLDTTVNTLGYNLSSIDTFAGYQNNGAHLANQVYDVYYSVVGNVDFLLLESVDYTPFMTVADGNTGGTMVQLTDTTGYLAYGVDAVRFDFKDDGVVYGSATDGTVYQEIDVKGNAAIPEPLVVSFVGLVGIGSLVVRRFHS